MEKLPIMVSTRSRHVPFTTWITHDGSCTLLNRHIRRRKRPIDDVCIYPARNFRNNKLHNTLLHRKRYRRKTIRLAGSSLPSSLSVFYPKNRTRFLRHRSSRNSIAFAFHSSLSKSNRREQNTALILNLHFRRVTVTSLLRHELGCSVLHPRFEFNIHFRINL